MEEKFLIDTNIIIYHLDGKIPDDQKKKVRRIFETSFTISTISNIEVLGWHKITEEDRIKTENFLSNAVVIYLDKIIETKSIELKRAYNIETPDSIIAATALDNNLVLVTRNTDDFKNIKHLKLFNPFL
ncbi:MAG: type II toxin-antitoxin system VapC family toxin [Bacteroidetes bacterium]|nr:MAG: type II toxin-antitoxin system VapC family toxin [Bacteroidota bacterium]